MKYLLYILTFSFSVITLFPASVFAYELKVAPDVSINENYASAGNLYITSVHAWFNTTHDKDVVSVSYDQTIGGTLFGDATLIGKDISIIGESFGDMRIVGDVVYISGVVNKDLIIAARHVIISPEAIINGDTLILAHTVELSGKFLGASQITASKISVNGSIEGVTTLTGSKIIFNTSAKILSDVSYFSPQKASVSSGVDIQKQLNFNQIESIKQNDVIKRLFFAFVSFWAIIKLIATLFVIFILTHLFRVPVQRIVDNVKEKKAFLLITGAGSFLLIPLLIVILFGSLVLIPVSVIVGAMFVIMIMLLPAMSAIISASLYQLYIQKQSKININFTFSAWALVVLTFIGFIPYVGGFVLYLLYIVSFGAMTQYFYDIVRRKKINF